MSKYKLSVFANGYIGILLGPGNGYIFEHRDVAEKMLGRPIRKDEVVHHLDFDRRNNTPENLLVLPESQHSKLHGWLSSIAFSPKHKYGNKTKEEILAKTNRCRYCSRPISLLLASFCNNKCSLRYGGKFFVSGKTKPDKKELVRLLKKYSWSKIGRRYGVSDNAIRILARTLGINPKNYARGKKR